ncbi:MAG: hypothetical protein KGL39_44180 [Patescibacteria group bacterium]|nr:hypothetical protein [Patescibacteria group bacterium]
MPQMTDNAGQTLTSKGRFYSQVSAATVSVAATRRVCRLLVTAGTGAITVYDNASTATGQVIWTKATVAVGDIYELDCPLVNGLTVVAAAATTVVVIYG